MKDRFIVVVAVFAFWCVLGASRPKAQSVISDATKAITTALQQQQKAVAAVVETQQRQSDVVKAAGDSPNAEQKSEIARAATAVVSARETLGQVATIDPKVAAEFLAEVDKTYESNRRSAHDYDLVLTLIAIGGIVLSLFAGICNFMSWPKVAGVLSLIVTAVIAAPKALSFEADRSLYRVLSSESYGLLVETRYDPDRSPAAYKERIRKLATLQRYSESPASGGDIETAIKSLQTELKSTNDTTKQPR